MQLQNAQKNEVSYSIYVVPNPNKSLEGIGSRLKQHQTIQMWKVPHITMISFILKSVKDSKKIGLRNLLKDVVSINWKPADITVSRGRELVTLKIKSRTLDNLLLKFRSAGLDAKTNLHVTLGTADEMRGWSQNDLEEIKKYLSELDWFLVIAKKEGDNVTIETDFIIKL